MRRVYYGRTPAGATTRTTLNEELQHAGAKAVLTIRRADFTRKAGDFHAVSGVQLYTTYLFLLTGCIPHACAQGRQETRMFSQRRKE
ncbi:hypothetical protein KCP76_07740 [Salmonella enterica subsp. enterica serovar Weltevreden]|nr:hypothetical protein KCP76_07740 [Salmonella enterica subsp. enterica serovar Weltevreden]